MRMPCPLLFGASFLFGGPSWVAGSPEAVHRHAQTCPLLFAAVIASEMS